MATDTTSCSSIRGSKCSLPCVHQFSPQVTQSHFFIGAAFPKTPTVSTHCWKSALMVLRNMRPHASRAQKQPLQPLGVVFPNISPRPQLLQSSPHLGTISAGKSKQSLTDAQNANHDQGRNHTNKQKCSHQWHLLFQTRGMGRALVHPCTSLQPTLLFQSPSIKATGFFPSLLGECGNPIFTPSNSGGITSVMLHTCNRTRASLLPAINSACLFLFKQNFS